MVQSSGEELFVGVDEYDAPANAALFDSTSDQHTEVRKLFTSHLFAVIKEAVTRGVVTKYWLTGVLPAFREGISPLTATNNISNWPQYHGLCGLTDAEVLAITTKYLGSDSAADKALPILRNWYNGYQFCPSSPDTIIKTLYNPQLLFTHLGGMRGGRRAEPKDEIEAIHTSSVLAAMPKDGAMTFWDVDSCLGGSS